ncbi:MAG: aldB [Rariglobus sp.]|nr:aldB [Rariglobus sp.]
MKKFLGCVAGLCVWTAALVAAERGVLTQWSTIDALLKGHYEGVATLGEVKQRGDFGLGTFEALDGEMVLLDGKVFQIDGQGAVHEPGDAVRTPFAAVTFFKADIELALPAGLTLEQVQARVDALLPSANLFYAVRVTGGFAEVRTRSVPRQEKPYPMLAEVVKTQSLFTITKTEGELVGLRCPGFSKAVNVPGHHFHYLAADRKSGGHVLGLVTGEGVRVRVAVLREFSVKLPESASFDALDLSGDRSKELHAVESERK